jgi:acyl-CoA synthetase (AMP-forming)/AMP-acid ligase II
MCRKTNVHHGIAPSRTGAPGPAGRGQPFGGERAVGAKVQPLPGRTVTAGDVRAFVKDRLGSVKAPKQVEVWPDLPRSKVGKVLKADIKARLRT